MDGLLLLDKPGGLTSSDAVLKVKRLLKRKVGHGGTLDPQATGLLLVFVGKATKIIPFFYPLEKGYIAKAKFGITTDTQDIWGNIQSEKDASFLAKGDIEKAIPGFTGTIEQIPPMVSALHHQGRRLYELAREGKIVEREKRRVSIYQLELIDFMDGKQPEATFKTACSGGTYIRTLFFDMGEALGTGASLSFLRRTAIGKFSIENAVTLESLKEKAKEKKIEGFIISMSDALYFMDEAVIEDAERIMEGRPVRIEGKEGLLKISTRDGIFIGIGENKKGILRPIKIIATYNDLL
ncbi:MAG: tRNA pseudouridine(55) synthase TruB [bacterium]